MTDFEDHDKTIIRLGATAAADPAAVAGLEGAHALPVGTRLGEFQITGLIGTGAFGNVYLAQDYSLGRTVALKEFMPQTLAIRQADGLSVGARSARHAEAFSAGLISFINEARLLARFDHPSLVKVHRFWEANGTAYMAMPFYEGQTLTQALRDRGTPPTEQWLKELLAPLLDVLQVIHAQNCFHLDIAPDNILLLKDGRPVLLDFGAARHAIGDFRNPDGALNAGYAPVEQYAKDSTVRPGAWTDIYALAAVVRYAIMGVAPAASIDRVIDDTMKPLEQTAKGRYSESFLRTIDRALSLGPEKRPQSAEELRTLLRLDAALASAVQGDPADGRNTQPRDTAAGTRAKAMWAGLVVVCLVAGGGFLLLRNNLRQPAPHVVQPVPAALPSVVSGASALPALTAAPQAAVSALPASSEPQASAPPVERAGAVGLPGSQAAASSTQLSVQSLSPVAKASEPRAVSSRTKSATVKPSIKPALTYTEPQTAPIPAASPPTSEVQAEPAHVPDPAPVPAGPSPVDICGKNRALLSACVSNRCKWPEFVNHPMCVELRAKGR